MKLGYGGTKSEMQRLLKDAEKLTGVKYDISNLKDVYLAVHAIQDEMGITGTTQKEAATTIEGSLNSTKAAWENVLTALAGGGDLNKAIDQLLKAVFGTGEGTGLLNQIKPRILQVFKGIGKFLKYLAPFITKNLPKLLKEILPSLMSAAVELIKSLPDIFASLIPGLVDSLGVLFETVFGTAEPDKRTFIELANKLTEGINGLFSEDVNWAEIGSTLSTALDNILTGVYTFINDIDWEAIGKAIGDFLINIDWLQLIADLILVIWAAIKGAWGLLTGLLDGLGVIDYWTDVVQKIGKFFVGIKNWLVKHVINPVVGFFDSIGKAISDFILDVVGGVKKFYNDLVYIFKSLPGWINKHIIKPIANFFSSLWKGIKNGLKSVKKWFGNIFEGIWTVVKGVLNTLIDGLNTVWSGIYTVVSGIVNTLSGVAETVGDLLGQDWSFSLPEEPPLIPKLAKGAVIPKNFGEFPVILGDNKQETEVVSPLSTIKRAVKEANAENGSAVFFDEYTLTKFARLVAKYLSFDIYLDTNALVGGTAPAMSRQLTKIQKLKARGGTV